MAREAQKVTPINLPQNNLTVLEEGLSRFKLDPAHLRKHKVFVHDDDDESRIAVSAYKSMRTHVLREMQKRNISTMMVTGVTQDVGKTTTSINLAISVAKHVEKRVILVDFDLRKPSFGEVFDIPINYGVDNILEKDFALGKAMLRTDLRRFFLLPCGQPHKDSTEMLMSARMQELLALLCKYDENLIVIFDTPPILGCDDVPAISAIMDACVLVVSEGETTRKELRQASRALSDVPILATILNRSTEANFDQYYY